jgi:hypothetical protein
VLLEQIGEDAAEAILKKVIAKARRGDMRAAEILLRRVWPEPRGRKVNFKMPSIRSAADAPQAIAAIISAVGEGVLTPTEGHECTGLVTNYTECLQAHTFEQRLNALENAAAEIDGNQINGQDQAD